MTRIDHSAALPQLDFSEEEERTGVHTIVGARNFEDASGVMRVARAASPETTGVRMIPLSAALRSTSRGQIIGNDPRIREVLSTIDRVAKSTCTVLVTGESGTGKESVVAALHDASPRRQAPLVAVNCGAISADLIESELFGHAKGAFTGAQNARRGYVAAAEGGTLFLDEVGELPLGAQVKLLRLLQQREYTPVGESRAMQCNIRVVAATNRDLEAEVTAGRFREDLYYRLNVIHVQLPSLRDRQGDIPCLANHFLKICSDRAERDDLTGFSESAMNALTHNEWTGNIRALENTIERAVLLSAGPVIELCDLPRKFQDASPVATTTTNAANEAPPESTTRMRTADAEATLPDGGTDLFAAVESYENTLIRQALAKTGGNKNQAARLLSVNRTTLVEMIKRKKIA